MMTNLFLVFDPTSTVLSLSINWLSTLLDLLIIPTSLWFLPTRTTIIWDKLVITLHKEFKTILGPNNPNKGTTFLFITIFTFIMFNNFMGLFPYIFTSSSHLTFTLSLALPLWLTFMLYGWINNTQHMFAHLLPAGISGPLMPFMVCIEITSNIIRPGTLAVRLMANMVAGHLLTLLASTGPSLTVSLLSLMMISQILLLTLESAVAIIQSYVFAVLTTLYSSEVTYVSTTKSPMSFGMDQSPWPLTGALGALITTTGFTKWFHQFNPEMFFMGLLIISLTMIQWWRDISREGTFQGLHTIQVTTGLRWGMILFIVSEVFFFISFFLAFFHSSLSPTVEIGAIWLPAGIQPFNPMQIPLLNTAILLASGVTVTWAHHSLMEANHTQTTQALILTVILGLYFTALQAFEYYEAPFTISDATYGSTFFMATGFHGLHVIIGSSFLMVCLLRHMMYHFSPNHHFGFEAAAWYRHFVDVVWLFLYISIYWWGG